MTARPAPDPTSGWNQSLYAGACGIALQHIVYAHSGAGSWTTVHDWATIMVRNPVNGHPDSCGLGWGAPAVAFSLNAAGHPGYAGVLAALDAQVDSLTRHRLLRAHARIDASELPELREFDLIRGLTGIGAHLLRRHRDAELLREVLLYLVRLTEPLNVSGRRCLPGWWSGNAPDDRPSARWPGGHGNFGMAHGIAGPLALLSAAMRRGIALRGQSEALGRICEWLDRWQTGTGTAAWWPELISEAERCSGRVRRTGPGRPSWCYGTPGLARAQQLAGLALRDRPRQRLAEQALAGCVADERQLALLADASLCHGWAGLLQTAWRMAGDADDPEPFAVARLLTGLDTHLLHHGPPPAVGLLEGAAGAELARHTVAAGVPPTSAWDACLLLDGGRI